MVAVVAALAAAQLMVPKACHRSAANEIATEQATLETYLALAARLVEAQQAVAAWKQLDPAHIATHNRIAAVALEHPVAV